MSHFAGSPQRIQTLRYERHGLPAEVLEEAQIELSAIGAGPSAGLRAGPSAGLRAGEVLVAMRFSAVHYSDLGLINGTYGKLKALPAVAGREGVGEVVALGDGVTNLKLGVRVRMPEDAGVWREAVVAKAADLFPIPAGVPDEQAAMAFINPPTAWLLLQHFVKLERGDWFIQNAGTSGVGVLVAQLARHFGWKCLSVVREAGVAEHLKQNGAALVVAEDSGYEKNPAKLTGGAPIKLALNAVGGESVGRLCRVVAPGGVVVTYGGATAEPMRFPTRPLIFNDITLRGFWLDQWTRTHSAAENAAMLEQLFSLLRKGVLQQPVAAKYPLKDWRLALDHAFRPSKGGKVLFEGQWKP